MSKAKYIYIDDEFDQTTEAIRDGLRDTGIVDVDLVQVKDFKDQITSFEGELREYDGAILDLRLDGNHALNVKYTAISLAQEHRARSAANEGIKDIPLILCSTDKKIRELYDRDQTSHDLFDFAFKKDKQPDWKEIAKTMESLAIGYDVLRSTPIAGLKFVGRDVDFIDSRIFGKFSDPDLQYPAHELAQHFIKDLFLQSGPLINRALLAARLGVDIENSPDWETLLNETFAKTQYVGVFCDGWNRWWADLVNEKFKELSGKRLAALNASERVNLLKATTGLEGLVAASPIEHNVSSNYWTVCEYFQKPLDPMEGFKVFARKQQKPWQDTQYLSFEAAAERKGIRDGLKIHPEEAGRLELAKEKVRQRR
ncbi:hypothetical protein [Roseivirga pacifica]|uniref:hypothetical protein n=1 Tax=Roseivirga pacifica TaxID=1267423 RepID=UPI003BB13E57